MSTIVENCLNDVELDVEDTNNNSLIVAKSSKEAFYNKMMIDKEIFDDNEASDYNRENIFNYNEEMFDEGIVDIEIVNQGAFDKMVDDEGWIN
ncbi:1469_t:CDS:2 [Dentiscutata erythropus]|uniref:1469_t:CDS:1 n=1 Tax=Dentiscutata erythropus TaxID=1348616 RepID=A0A9N9B6T2_9GLOM|nr:1469_t:CDS:2 [Dentiscutata erythropus]